MGSQSFKHLIVGLLTTSTLSVFAADFDVTSQSGDEASATSLPGIVNTNIYLADGDRILYDFATPDSFTTILEQNLELDLDLTISTKDVTRDLFIGVSLDDGTYSSTINVIDSSCTMTGFVTVQNDIVFTYDGSLTVNSVEGVTSPSYAGTFSGDGDLIISGSQDSTFSGVLSQVNTYSGLSVTKNGIGTSILSGDNTYTGDTLVEKGTLNFTGNVTNLPSSITVSSDAELVVGSLASGGSQHFSGDIDGTGFLIKDVASGSNLVTMSGDMLLSGDVVIEAGSISFTGGITSLEGDVQINSGAVLDFSPLAGAAYGQLIAGDITGGGGIIVNGANTTVLLGNLFYEGQTILNSNLDILGAVSDLTSAITINTGGELTVGSSSNQGFSGDIDGVGDLVFAGSGGTSLFSGAATYRGTTSMSGSGTLAFQGATSLPGDISLVDSSVILQVGAISALTQSFGGDISGAGSVHKEFSGTTTFSGDVSYTGSTFINAGNLAFTGSVADFDSDISILGGSTLTVGGIGYTQNFDGAITGFGKVVKNSSGTTEFSGDCDYLGSTTINAGELTFNGEVTDLQSAISVGSGATLGFDSDDDQVFSGVISGSGDVTKSSLGTTTILNNPSYSGSTTIDALGGTLAFSGPVSNLSGSISIGTSSTLLVGHSGDQLFSGDVTGAGSVTQSTSGLTFFSGDLRYEGQTTVSLGKMFFTGAITELPSPISIADNAQFYLDSSSGQTLSGNITGSGTFVKDGTGMALLSADIGFTGNIDIEKGTLIFGGGITDLASDIFIDGNGTLNLNAPGSQLFSGDISGSGNVFKTSNQTSTFSGNPTFSGDTNIQAGELSFTGAVANLSSDILIGAISTLSFNSSSDQIFSGEITGQGVVEKNGSGTTTISSNSYYSGNTTIGAGVLNFNSAISDLSSDMSIASGATLRVGADVTQFFSGDMSGDGGLNKVNFGTTMMSGDIGLTGDISIDAGTLEFTGALTDLSSDITIAEGATLESYSSSDHLFSGVISGDGGFLKNGTGTATMSGNVSYSEATLLNNGTLAFTGAITDLPSEISMNGNTNLQIGSVSSQVFSGDIAGGASTTLTKVSSGRSTISGDFSYTGPTTISGGILTLSGDEANLSGSVTIASGATFDYGISGDITLSNTVSGAGNFTKSGSGTVTIADSYTYTGDTTVLADTLFFNSLDYAGDFGVSSGASLSVGYSNDQALSGSIFGGGTLSKFGSGTVTLSTDSPITGNTTISAGALAVNAALGSANVIVNSGAILKGTGSVVNVNNSGFVAPGASIGTLSVLGDYVQNSGARLVNEFNSSATDLLQVTGSATFNTGSILRLDPEENQSYVQDARYTIVTADGGRSGKFSTLEMVTNSLLDLSQISIEYFDDRIELVLNPNEYINSTINMNSQLTLKSSQAQFNNFRAINDRNLYSYDWCSGGNCGDKEKKNKTCEEFPCKNQGWDVYALTSYTGFDIKESSKRDPAHIKASATTIGAEYVFDDYGSFGMGVGYTYGQVKNPNIEGNKTKSNAFTVGVTGIYAPIKYLSFDVVGNIDAVWYSMDRITTKNFSNKNAKATPDGTQANAALRINGRFCLFTALFQPFYSTQYSWRRIDGYTESGPVYTSYEVSRESLSYWNGEGGLMVSKTIKRNDLCYIPHINISYVFKYNKPTDFVAIRNRGDNDYNNIQNYKVDYLNTNYLKVGGGFDILNKETFRGYVEANGYIENQLNSSFDVRVGMNFYF